MIVAWIAGEKGLVRQECTGPRIPDGALWIDCVDITPEEEHLAEHHGCT